MNPLALLKFAPWALALVLGLAFGWEYTTVQERDVTIAEKDTVLANMQKQQAENIATAVKAERDAKERDAARAAEIIIDLHARNRDTEEKLNAASIALAQAPVQVIPPGCPDPNRSPAAIAFDAGLPRDE